MVKLRVDKTFDRGVIAATLRCRLLARLIVKRPRVVIAIGCLERLDCFLMALSHTDVIKALEQAHSVKGIDNKGIVGLIRSGNRLIF